MNQAKAAGYKRYVSCHRSGGGGEHPKGRACDFAAATSGFKNADATGGDRTYGNNLAAYYVKNASSLGVLYVIWYRQIWMPGTGWRSYSGGGSPAADHTNHVHLSMVCAKPALACVRSHRWTHHPRTQPVRPAHP